MDTRTSLFPSKSDYALVKRTWRGDLLAGITVGIVALPLALGFGISSGAGAEAGLITAIVAGIIAALAAIESLLSARVAASMADTGPYDPDRELVGQGLASIGAGLFGGMPATGAIARTAVNVRSGGRTRVAAVFHAVVLLLIVMLFAQPVGFIPLAALSGVLMVTAARMVNVAVAGSILRSTRADALAFVVTAIVTVSFDLIVAVVVGMLLAGVFAIRSYASAAGVHREDLPGDAEPGDERIALIVIDGPLFFGSADRVLDEIVKTKDVSVVILRLSRLDTVDATGANSLVEIVQRLEARGITMIIKGLREQHLELFTRIGVISALRHKNHLVADLEASIVHARSHIRREIAKGS